jgi:hypothetical protein
MTSLRTLEFCQDLKGSLYIEFIRYAFATSKEVYFVVREDVQTGPNIAAVVETIVPHLISQQEVKEWPGTRLVGGHVAKLYTFVAADPVMRLFLSMTDHLYGWQQPDLPEDIGFRDREGKVVIESTIHEQYLSILLDDSRTKILKEQFPRLMQVLLTSGLDSQPG